MCGTVKTSELTVADTGGGGGGGGGGSVVSGPPLRPDDE